ncbi:MAG: hypothetical protein ACRC0V_07235 [Fusobacteriaceae bacterium]|uniref:hypothetical protein n=1 Tax=Romboutsia sp. TaxID=1965302 RepID=UPI003F3072E4
MANFTINNEAKISDSTNDLIFTVQTTVPNKSISWNMYNHNLTVQTDWADGTINTSTNHTYVTAGTYQIKVKMTGITNSGSFLVLNGIDIISVERLPKVLDNISPANIYFNQIQLRENKLPLTEIRKILTAFDTNMAISSTYSYLYLDKQNISNYVLTQSDINIAQSIMSKNIYISYAKNENTIGRYRVPTDVDKTVFNDTTLTLSVTAPLVRMGILLNNSVNYGKQQYYPRINNFITGAGFVSPSYDINNNIISDATITIQDYPINSQVVFTVDINSYTQITKLGNVFWSS